MTARRHGGLEVPVAGAAEAGGGGGAPEGQAVPRGRLLLEESLRAQVGKLV